MIWRFKKVIQIIIAAWCVDSEVVYAAGLKQKAFGAYCKLHHFYHHASFIIQPPYEKCEARFCTACCNKIVHDGETVKLTGYGCCCQYKAQKPLMHLAAGYDYSDNYTRDNPVHGPTYCCCVKSTTMTLHAHKKPDATITVPQSPKAKRD